MYKLLERHTPLIGSIYTMLFITTAAIVYQWLPGGEEIVGATGSTYTVQTSDQGSAISVKVSFTDDEGFEESLTSSETAAVVAGGL